MKGKDGKRRVAVACEGGGAHTAFTAGVLQRLLEEQLDEQIEIVALSGTSGGAVCAMLAWRGLLDGDCDDAIRRLQGFWRDIATFGWEAIRDAWLFLGARLVGEVFSPEVSPYSHPWSDAAQERLKQLLERYCGFAKVPDLLQANEAAPRLLISAADVRSGKFAVFRSHKVTHRGTTYPAAKITADAILASAAVPNVFKAVHIDADQLPSDLVKADGQGRDYWDGLFSQNPPIRELPDMVRTMPGKQPPHEIWIVRINPTTWRPPPQRRRGQPSRGLTTPRDVPDSMAEIRDRRNELAGIISLSQELYFLDFINHLVDCGKLGDEKTKHKPIVLRSIKMSDDFAHRLDYHSKLDRLRHSIEDLKRHGVERTDEFLSNRDNHLEPATD